MKKLALLLSFFAILPLVLVTALTLALLSTYPGSKSVASVPARSSQPVAYAALPGSSESSIESIEYTKSDAKTESVRQFLARYNSPLEPHAGVLVEKAVKYGLDPRLLPAIAMQESNLCKKVRADSAHNCWGWGIYGGKGKAFESYEHGIEVVAEALSRKYKNTHGLVTPSEIEKLYNPNSTGSWSFSVNHFMSQML